MAKYDWAALKREYLTGDHKSVREFAKVKGIPYQSIRDKTKGWSDEKRSKNGAKTEQITEGILKNEIQHAIDRNAQHLAAGDLIMTRLNLAIDAIKPENKRALSLLKTAAEALEKVQKSQRLAEGDNAPEDNGVLPAILEYLRDERTGE